MISYLSSIVAMPRSYTVSEILSLISGNLKTSRDHDHAIRGTVCNPMLNGHLATSVQNLKSLASAIPEIWMGPPKFKMGRLI